MKEKVFLPVIQEGCFLPRAEQKPQEDGEQVLPRPGSVRWKRKQKLPPWLKIRLYTGDKFARIKSLTKGLKLNTVCQEACCPNIFECWSGGTATFMILGDVCTRACGFCAVKTGPGLPVDLDEPRHVAQAVKSMGIKHAVVTSVNRDDLPDGGASHFADTIQWIRRLCQQTTVEVLIPDFQGNWDALEVVLKAKPDVLNHNIETVPRLYRRVRARADYKRSLELLYRAGKFRDEEHASMLTKSGIMVGLGESRGEVSETIRDIREQGVDILTVGQYLRPSMNNLPVERYWRPEEFKALKEEALALGFVCVESGPLVRSSYHAERHLLRR